MINLVCLFLAIIIFIHRLMCPREYNGGNSDTENTAEFIKIITRNMVEPAKTQFIKEFNKTRTSDARPAIVTMDDIDVAIPYQPKSAFFARSTHIGQRKLALNEIQFCTEQIGTKAATVVYAGAAPNNKGAFVASLFPNIKFIMVDPNPFHITITDYPELKPKIWNNGDISRIAKTKTRINIINDYMTVDLSASIAKYIPDVYFISDIRTNTTDVDYPDASDLLWNNAQQLNWMTIMKPISSMLKFRHPFYAETDKYFLEVSQKEPMKSDFELAKRNGIDFVDNYMQRKLVYFDGIIYLQAFAGITSTETRLVTKGTSFKEYIVSDYDDRLFYYNAIARNFALFENENANKQLGFDQCADCAIENDIWNKYRKLNGDKSVVELVKILSKYTGRSLIRELHGTMFGKTPIDKLTRDLNVQKSVKK